MALSGKLARQLQQELFNQARQTAPRIARRTFGSQAPRCIRQQRQTKATPNNIRSFTRSARQCANQTETVDVQLTDVTLVATAVATVATNVGTAGYDPKTATDLTDITQIGPDLRFTATLPQKPSNHPAHRPAPEWES